MFKVQSGLELRIVVPGDVHVSASFMVPICTHGTQMGACTWLVTRCEYFMFFHVSDRHEKKHLDVMLKKK